MKTTIDQLFEQTLRQADASLTTPRRQVFEALLDQKPQSLAHLVRTLHGKVDRASVYRAIELFERLDIIRKVHIGWKYQLELTERFTHHHHHVYCRSCGTLIDITEPPSLERYIEFISQKTGFAITAHTFELEGVCSVCQKDATSLQPPSLAV